MKLFAKIRQTMVTFYKKHPRSWILGFFISYIGFTAGFCTTVPVAVVFLVSQEVLVSGLITVVTILAGLTIVFVSVAVADALWDTEVLQRI